MTDIIDLGENAISDAATKAVEKSVASGSPVGSIAAGAIKGAAIGASVAEGISVGVPLASMGVAAVAASAGASAATTFSIMGAGMAIGSSIPIPGLGTVIGIIVGALIAISKAFHDPPPELARELIAVFTCYPNVLRQWITEGSVDIGGTGFQGVHAETQFDMGARWAYVAMLRRQAKFGGFDAGPDDLENFVWQTRFLAGDDAAEKVLACKHQPDFKVLGINPSDAEITQAVTGLRLVTAGLPVSFHVGPSKRAVLMTGQAVLPPGPAYDAAKASWKYARPMLLAYNNKVPVIFRALPPIVQAPDAGAQTAAKSLAQAYGRYDWFRGADVVTTPSGGYGIEVSVTDLPKGVTPAALASFAGLPVTIKTGVGPWPWLLAGAAALGLVGAAAWKSRDTSWEAGSVFAVFDEPWRYEYRPGHAYDIDGSTYIATSTAYTLRDPSDFRLESPLVLDAETWTQLAAEGRLRRIS